MKYIYLFLLLFFSAETLAQFNHSAVKGAIQLPPSYDTCYAYVSTEQSRIHNTNPRFLKFKELHNTDKKSARVYQNTLATSEIEIIFTSNFNAVPEAKEAFRFAADMWEMEIVSSVPIVVFADFRALGSNTIGQNSSNRVINVPNAPDPTLAYVSSLGNAISGTDLLPGQPDLIQTYNSDFNFYYGTDANPPAGEMDFVTIAFHEIGHGLGITGSSNAGNGVGMNLGRNPMIWDFYVELGSGISIIDLGFSTPEQQAALVSNNLFIDSYFSTKALDGIRPKIYAPTDFNPGSSYSHWDENTFLRGTPNSLMTPFNATGEAIHDPGDITRGILRDMGWELASKLNVDLAVLEIISPTSGVNLGEESVTVEIGNAGLSEVSKIDISYRIDGGEWITGTYSGLIQPMGTDFFTFPQRANLSVPGKTYTIEVRIDYFIDENQENNTLTKTVTHLLPVTSFPYTESFEDGKSSWAVEGDPVWELGVPSGDILNAASDGDTAWVTNLSGNYPDESTSFLVSPVFDFTNRHDPIIEFDLWYDIEFGWDGLALQASFNNGSTWQTVGSFGDGLNWYNDGDTRPAAPDESEGSDGIDALIAAVGDGDGWTGTGATGTNGYVTARHTIQGAGGQENVMLRFVFASDQAVNEEGAAIDNVSIFAPEIVENDVGVTQILSPESGNLGNQETIRIRVKNFGTAAAADFNVGYQINDNMPVVETVTQSIAAGADDTYTFTTPADLSVKQAYTIKAFTSYTTDQNAINDTSTVIIESIQTISSFPYKESFETGDGFWFALGDSSSWELATPSGLKINSASDGNMAWITNADGEYNNSETSYLQSPAFDFTNVTQPRIVFDLWYETEDLKDGLFLQFSTDRGSTWQTMTTDGESDINGYNTIGLRSQFNPIGLAWSGSSSGYQTVVINPAVLSGETFVQFRFVFTSNRSNKDEGIAIDNIRIFDVADISYTITCPANVSVGNDPGENFAFVGLDNPAVSTTGGTITYSNTFTNSADPAANYPIGTTNVDFIVDVDGVVRTCSATVTVDDIEPPVIICPDDKTVAVPPGTSSTTVTYNQPIVSDNYGFLTQFTYSTNQTVDGESGIACATGPNSFIRIFELKEDFQVENSFDIKSVDVGVQVVNEGDVHAEGNFVPAKINLYLFNTTQFSKDNPAEFIFNNMILLKSQDFLLPIGIENEIVNVPVEATVPEGYAVVVEFYTEAGSDQVFPGANPVQTGDSYIVAPSCGINDPTSVSSPELDFPDSQWIMNLNGLSKSSDEAVLVSGNASGTSFPLGANTVEFSAEDISGLTSTCSFTVNVVEAELSTPVNLTVIDQAETSLTIAWDSVAGVDFYQLSVSKDDFQSFDQQYDGLIVSDTSVQLTGLAPNQAYFIKVRSVNNSSDPTQFSAFSNRLLTTTTIAAPQVFPPEFITDTQFKFAWTPIENIDRYQIQVSTDNFATLAFNKIRTGDELLVEDLQPNTLYSYRVRAVNAAGESVYSNIGTAATLPDEPTALPVTEIQAESFTAKWNAVTGAESYFIDVSRDNFETLVVDSMEVTGTSYTVTGLKSNTNYQYRVRAFSSVGGSSLNSNIIFVTTHAKVPVALDPSKVTDYGVKAQWTSTNAHAYELDVSKDNFDTFVVKDFIVNDTTEAVFRLSANTTYSYRVRAVNRKGVVSPSSNVVTFTTTDLPLAVPTATEATDIKTFSFRANWTEVPEAQFYSVQISDDNFATVLDEFTGFGNSLTIAGLEDDKQYYYRVQAQNNEASSEFSNIVPVMTILGVGGENYELTFYPNPVKDVFTVLTSQFIQDLEVYNIGGQRQSVNVINYDRKMLNINMSHLEKGIYIALLRYENGQVGSIKFVKQ
ncbi:MAG: fibronectin type III domain-containing protein [Candidatus Cyclobacteriaceae bacterium M2_1C_046]